MLGTLVGGTLRAASQKAGMGLGTAAKYSMSSVGKVAKGGVIAGFTALTAMQEGPEHGYGYGVAKGLAYWTPITGSALFAYDMSMIALEAGNNYFQQRRKLEMFSPVQDLYGNTATMRQRSMQSLDRGRGILGSEAQYLR